MIATVKRAKKLTPLRILVVGYFLITMISAFLLSLPAASKSGQPQFFVDSMFVAFSGISTTGLTVVDVGSYYSMFGQIVLLCTFQIGGIGYMALVIILITALNGKHSLTTQVVAVEGMAGYGHHNYLRFSVLVVVTTLVIELGGALALYFFSGNEFSPGRGFFNAVFHSVAAFCTAGFTVLPDSMMRYRDNLPVNITINVVSYLGAIGFIVIYDLLHFFKAKIKGLRRVRLTLHSKVVLVGFTAVILIGALVTLFCEPWPDAVGVGQRINRSVFQSISASTTDGFNTMDIGAMSPASQTMMILQMFTGAAPGSTGGGIKITTLILLVLFIRAQLKGRENPVVVLGKREIQNGGVGKALGVAAWFLIIILIDLLVMVNTEAGHANYLQVLFEIVSALGNTGLSMGITADLSVVGKLLLTLAMFIGRVGPLTLGFALAKKENTTLFRYPKEEIFIG